MTGLFKKLNTLVKAKINDALEFPELGNALSRLNPRLETDARRMRERINDAIAYEDELQAKVNALQTEVDRLDQEADQAVNAQQEDRARALIKSLTDARRRLDFAEADLRQHRLVAEDLIRQVNLMEATIADARHEEPSAPPADTSSSQSASPPALERLNQALNQAQDSINRLRDKVSTRAESGAANPVVENAANEAEVEDDLAARRQRLSGSPPKS